MRFLISILLLVGLGVNAAGSPRRVPSVEFLVRRRIRSRRRYPPKLQRRLPKFSRMRLRR